MQILVYYLQLKKNEYSDLYVPLVYPRGLCTHTQNKWTYAQFIALFLGLFLLSYLEKISHLVLHLERIIYGLWLVSALEFTQ